MEVKIAPIVQRSVGGMMLTTWLGFFEIFFFVSFYVALRQMYMLA